ncbi:MAG: PQQ-binding-like beta-propeller repeat protein [Phycisphaeraceae bacterium]|nr:PQQ-binding-like beta-propeller repeat protein [Phycisphaeraceae bacterium]
MPISFFCRLVGATLAALCLAGPAMGQNPNVTVDDQPTAEQRLEEVLELRRAKRYAEAAELVQEMIDASAFKLVALGEGSYSDAGRWANGVLLWDGRLRQAYNERYSAAAERAYEQAMASGQQLTALSRVYRRYAATDAGLRAGLAASGLLLESGQAESAQPLIAQLLRHPGSGAAMKTLQMVRGAAAAYLQDESSLGDAIDRLEEIDAASAQGLAELAASIQPVQFAVDQAMVDAGPKPVSIRVSLWDQSLATADNASRWRLSDQSVRPMITAGFVLLNNGRQIVALDRASGQRAWAYPVDDDSSVQKTITAQRWQDDRTVARAQGKVAAVLGESHGITERRNPNVPPNDLACVDEQTGKVLWTRTAGDFREDEPTLAADRRVGRLNLQLTHFVGTPVMTQGKVFAVLRRASSEADTQSSWLLAYDADTGSLLWYRHLALVSLSYTNADSMRVSPRLTLHGDTIYMSDGLSSIGAIDLHTGGYRWLRVLPVGRENTRSIVASTRGLQSGPTVTSAGLLVPLSLSSDRLMLVDPEDGSVLRSFKEDPVLSKTRYTLKTSKGVLAISQTAISLWDADKAAVAWTFALGGGETMRGMGVASLRYAVLPTNQRLLVLDLETGELIEQAKSMMSSVALHDGELYTVGEGRLHAFTSWDRVYKRLVQQVESRPEDPSAGLSLASIALRQQDQPDSVIQGVGHAMDAVARQPPRRRAEVSSHVFEQLRLLIPQAEQPELREALYERLALVTQTAAHEAAYHLDVGLFFAQRGDTSRAIDHLHAVISEPAFAGASYESQGVIRPAGSIARQQIKRLIERHGRGVYARYDALARAQMNALTQAGNLSSASFTAIARRFPLSPLAGELLIEAADASAAERRLIAAASLYKQALSSAVGARQREHAAGKLLQFYLDTGRPGVAAEALTYLTTQHPGLVPKAQAQTLEQWHQAIAQAPPTPDKLTPLDASLAAPVLIKGWLIPPATTRRSASPADHLYLQQDDNTVTCHAPADPGKPLWTTPSPETAGPIALIAEHAEQVLFWGTDSGDVFALDTKTGQRLWHTTLKFDEITGKPVPAPQPRDGETDTLVEVSETVVCFAHRASAQVIAIDRASGDVLWRTKLEMASLTAIDADEWSVAVVGRAGHPQQLRSGKLSLLSLADARPLLPQGQARIALTPFGVQLQRGQVTVLGASGVMSIDASTGRTRWTERLPEKMLTGNYAIAGQRIAVETNTGEVYLLDAANKGKPLGSVAVRGGGDHIPVRLQSIKGTIWCLGTRGVFRIGQDGVLDWTTPIPTPRSTPASLLVGQDHVALITRPNPAPVENGLKLDLIEAAGGRLVEQYEIGPLINEALPTHARSFGQGLAIPVAGQTLIIPPAKP